MSRSSAVCGALVLVLAGCSLDESGGGEASATSDSGSGGTGVNSDASLGGGPATGGAGAGGSGGQAGGTGGGSGGAAASGGTGGAVADAGTDAATGRVTAGLVLLYEFEDGSGTTVADTSGNGSPYDLIISDENNVKWGKNHLDVQSEIRIANNSPPTKVHDQCKQSKELSLEAWVTPKNTGQGSHARILSNSMDEFSRNFALMQMDDSFGIRLRTSTNPTGTPEIKTPLGTATTKLTHVVFTRASNGSSGLYVDSALIKGNTVSGDFGNWDGTWGLVLANEFTDSRTWLGKIHLVAVSCRALSAADVITNFSEGP